MSQYQPIKSSLEIGYYCSTRLPPTRSCHRVLPLVILPSNTYAPTLLVPRTDPSPGRQVLGVGKPLHLGPNFCQDRGGGDDLDARDARAATASPPHRGGPAA